MKILWQYFYAALLLLLSALLLGPVFETAYATEDITTIATGVAVIQGDNISSAQEEATRDALRQALEQGVGMMVESRTVLHNDDLMEKIYTDTRGYIKSYEIISQKEKNRGLYSVKVKAIVKAGALRDSLVDLGIIKAMMDYPRLLILPSPDVKISPEVEMAEIFLIKYFSDRRFDLVDATKSLEIHGKAGRLLKTGTLEDISARLGLQHHAELVVLFAIESLPGEFDGMLENVPITMQSKAIMTDTAQVLAAEQFGKTGLGRSRSQARDNGIKITSENMANALINSIGSWWADYIANGIPYTVTLEAEPGRGRQVIAFQQAIKSIPGVVSISERSSGDGLTEMMVKYKGPIRDLKKEIFTVTEMKSGFEKLHTETAKGRFLIFSVL